MRWPCTGMHDATHTRPLLIQAPPPRPAPQPPGAPGSAPWPHAAPGPRPPPPAAPGPPPPRRAACAARRWARSTPPPGAPPGGRGHEWREHRAAVLTLCGSGRTFRGCVRPCQAVITSARSGAQSGTLPWTGRCLCNAVRRCSRAETALWRGERQRGAAHLWRNEVCLRLAVLRVILGPHRREGYALAPVACSARPRSALIQQAAGDIAPDTLQLASAQLACLHNRPLPSPRQY